MLTLIIAGATFGGGIGAAIMAAGVVAWMVWGRDEE